MSSKILVMHKTVEQLFYKVYPTFRNFPKSEKFAMCQFIKEHFVKILSSISLAHSVNSRRVIYLQEAGANIENLIVLLKLCREQHYISNTFFTEIDFTMSNIKLMLSDMFKIK